MAIEFNVESQVKTFATLSAFPSIGAVKTIYIALDTKLMYVYDSGAYTSIGDATSAEWGHINGDITSQVDLQAALNDKFNNPTGDSTQYLDGAGTPTIFPAFASADKMVTIGRNATGSTLYKGTIVYINGSTGNRPNFVKAQANSEMTSAGTFGVVESDIPNNADGNCVTIGTISNLDTRSSAPHPFTSDTLVDGDTIYLSPTTAGYITRVKPSAPNHLVYLGKVVRTSPTNGTIVYRVQNGYELDELHDVTTIDYTTPQDEDSVLILDSTQLLWKRLTLFNLYTYVKTYFDTIYQSALGFTPENVANKQTDLTASATKYPTVNAVNSGLATKEPTITPGTTSQYFRGDKTFQTLDKNTVGLSNVDNTSDASKPVSTAQATAIGLKENSANKATTMTGNETSNTLFLTAKAIYDWAVALFQAKLVSGTNIKTINGASVLGSGDITISGGGASGIHTILKAGGSLFGGVETSNMVSSANLSSYTCQANQMIYTPYVPNNDFTSTTIAFNVSSGTALAKCKLYIYSHNGVNAPNSQLYESAEIDLSTTGNKTINVTYNFTKGTIYWFGIYSNIFGPNISAMTSNGGALPVAWTGSVLILSWIQISITYPTAPTTAAPNSYSNTAPLIRLK